MKRLAMLLVLLPAVAHAGAFGRVNQIDARAVGIAGAFTAVADDPSAVWFNPAGLAQIPQTTVLAGVDLVAVTFDSVPATCSPNNVTSTNCAKVEASAMVPLPALAFSTRFAGAGGRDPSRFAVGFGMFVTQGLQVEYNQSQLKTAGENPGIISTKFAMLELVPSLAYKVNDVLSVGASLRAGVMGMGLTDFSSITDTRPSNATLNGSGAGFGFAVGVIARPLPDLSLGLNYRSEVNVSVSGDASIVGTGSTTPQAAGFNLSVPWPQAVSFGLAYRVLPQLRVMAQFDWTEWSSFDALAPHFSDPNLDKLGRVLLDYSDNYTIRAGAEYAVGENVILRAGYAYDSDAVPDRTLDRQLIDGPKSVLSGGIGLRLGDKMLIDAAGDALFGSPRTEPTSDMTVPKYLRNVNPGSYEAAVYSFQLTGRYQF
jgi:long-chain fatty acid transport protein